MNTSDRNETKGSRQKGCFVNQWPTDQYQLIDFGDGRKLERFGPRILNRPSPAASLVGKAQPSAWQAADLTVSERGEVTWNSAKSGMPGGISTAGTAHPPQAVEPKREAWQINVPPLRMEIKLTPFGHVGLFPEQLSNWSWLHQWSLERSPRALNLFAYTGGTTLALAAAGAAVVHVDASKPAVSWARRNAKLSGLEHFPIRWIVEDARKFVRRECRRGNTYDIISLDPPSFGHGPKGKQWEIQRDLRGLIDDCLNLLSPSDALILLTGHSVAPSPEEIKHHLSAAAAWSDLQAHRLVLFDQQERPLDFGFAIRGSR